MLTLDKIYKAAHTLKGTARLTDLIPAPNLNPESESYLKAENLQLTGSFKLRGAFYKISTLTKEEKEKGIIACSAGNHAQGVALSAQKAGIKATIFIPSIAPISKIEATRKYGAEIKLIDGVYDDAYNAAIKYQKETGAIFIHPFDDDEVIAGQGTIGLELLEQLPDLDAVIVPIGGGGLISGVAFVIKTLNPKCKVYGVQAQGAKSMINALEHHEIETLKSVATFADGIAVKTPGENTFDICSKYVDEVIPEKDWDQKPEDIKKYNIDILTMGSDWEGNPKFEYLKEYCDVRFTKRPFIWSSTAFRKKVDEYAKGLMKEV